VRLSAPACVPHGRPHEGIVALPAALTPLKILLNLVGVSQLAFRAYSLEIYVLIACSKPEPSTVVGFDSKCPVFLSLYAAISVLVINST
jgi:hypothetical protein